MWVEKFFYSKKMYFYQKLVRSERGLWFFYCSLFLQFMLLKNGDIMPY